VLWTIKQLTQFTGFTQAARHNQFLQYSGPFYTHIGYRMSLHTSGIMHVITEELSNFFQLSYSSFIREKGKEAREDEELEERAREEGGCKEEST
jgi:hypothetical protein